MRIGRWLHELMLPVALAAVSLLPRLKGGPGRWSACGRGLALWAASSLAGMTVPACLGGLRVLLTGVLLPLTTLTTDSTCQESSSPADCQLLLCRGIGTSRCELQACYMGELCRCFENGLPEVSNGSAI